MTGTLRSSLTCLSPSDSEVVEMICVPSEIEKYNEEYGDLTGDTGNNYRVGSDQSSYRLQW